MSTETAAAAQVTPNAATENQTVVTPAVETPAVVAAPVTETPKAPEKYELKLPDGSHLKPEQLEQLSSYAKEKKLTNDQAQELLMREHSALDSFAKAQMTEFENVKEVWKQEAMKDVEIGGDNFVKNVELAHRALEKFGTQRLRDELNATGYGNHPELIRVFARMGKEMADDKMIVSGAQTGGTRTYEDIFYGDTTKT